MQQPWRIGPELADKWRGTDGCGVCAATRQALPACGAGLLDPTECRTLARLWFVIAGREIHHARSRLAIHPQPGQQPVGVAAVADALHAVSEGIVAAVRQATGEGMHGQSVAAGKAALDADRIVFLEGEAVAVLEAPFRADHRVYRCRREQADAIDLAIAQQQPTDLRQVRGGNAQATLRAEYIRRLAGAPRRQVATAIAGLGDATSGLLALMVVDRRLAVLVEHHRTRGGGLVATRPAVAGMQVERLQHQSLHQQVEALASGALHHRADQREADVRVAPIGAGCVRGVPCLRIVEELPEFAIQRHLPVAGAIGQAGRVREQQTQGDFLFRESGVADVPAQRVGDIGIQIELAFLDQSHHPDRQHQLADRCDAYWIVDADRALVRGIRVALGTGGRDAVAVEGHPHTGLRRCGGRFGSMRTGRDQQEGSDDAGSQAHGRSTRAMPGFIAKSCRWLEGNRVQSRRCPYQSASASRSRRMVRPCRAKRHSRRRWSRAPNVRSLRSEVRTDSRRITKRPSRASARLIATSSPAYQVSSKPPALSKAARVQKMKQPGAMPVRRNARLASAASARACAEVAPMKSTPAPPPTAPPCNACSAARRTVASMRVSASTNTSSGCVVARAPALRVAAIWRCSTRSTRAPWSRAMPAVASVDASSTTSSSYARSSAVAAPCSASRVAPIRRASSCAGTTKDTGGCAFSARPSCTPAVARSPFNRPPCGPLQAASRRRWARRDACRLRARWATTRL